MNEQAAATTVAAGSPGTAGWLSSAFDALGNIIPAFAPNGGNNNQPIVIQQEASKSNTMLYVVGAVLLMVVLYFVFKSKKA